MACIVCEPRLTKKAINGGPSETEVRLPTVIPTGAPAALVEITATEVGTLPSTRRKSRGSTAVGGGVGAVGTAGTFVWFGMGSPRRRCAMQGVQREHHRRNLCQQPKSPR